MNRRELMKVAPAAIFLAGTEAALSGDPAAAADAKPDTLPIDWRVVCDALEDGQHEKADGWALQIEGAVARTRLTARAVGYPPERVAELEAIVRRGMALKPDQADLSAMIEAGIYHLISLDWIMCGDLVPLIRHAGEGVRFHGQRDKYREERRRLRRGPQLAVASGTGVA